MSKTFWLTLAAILVILGGIVYLDNLNRHSAGGYGKPTNHIEGSSPTGARLIEYGDYQCPVCGSFYAAVKQAAAKYSTKLIFQFRNLPLTQPHPNAFAGARAAEAAGLQGKYWEMHDLLYEQNVAYYNSNETTQTWINSPDPLSYFTQYAQSLGLSVSKFTADYASDRVNNAINADLDAFAKTGDDMATPTFYLNGQKLSNADLIDSSGQPSLTAFSKVIDTILAGKKYTPTPIGQ